MNIDYESNAFNFKFWIANIIKFGYDLPIQRLCC